MRKLAGWTILLLGLVPVAVRAAECPMAVKSAVAAAHPGAAIARCRVEDEGAGRQYDVALRLKDGGRLDVDVTPDGEILRTEEPIPRSAVPDAVVKALLAKSPDAKDIAAEKVTEADGSVSYECAFTTKGGRTESAFAPDGKPAGDESVADDDDDDDDEGGE